MTPYDFEADRKKQLDDLARLANANQAGAAATVGETSLADSVRPKLEGLRKFNNKAYALLSLIKFGFFGAISVLLGLMFLWAGAAGGFEWKTVGLGAVMALLGLWFLRIARASWFDLRRGEP